MLERDQIVDGSVLLVSDLETAPDDVPALASTIESLRQAGIGLQVVALGPSTDARLLFGDAIEDGVFEAPSSPGEETARRRDDGHLSSDARDSGCASVCRARRTRALRRAARGDRSIRR